MSKIDKPINCPLCEEGKLVPGTRSERVRIKGDVFREVPFEYSICEACGSEITTPKQAKSNQNNIREIQRQFDGLLSGKEIKLIRKKYNLTQADASLVFGGGANAFSKYERGEVIQSVPMDRLLRVAQDIPSALIKLVELATSEKVVITRKVRFSTTETVSSDEFLRRPSGKPVATHETFPRERCANQFSNWQDDSQASKTLVNG